MQQNNKRNFFERFTEIMGWLQIVASPLMLGTVIGFLIYLSYPGGGGLFGVIAITTAGLIIGIIFATRVWKKKGTMHFLSRVSATPELDADEEKGKEKE